MTDSFSTHDTLEVNGERYRIASLAKLGKRFNLGRLPYSMKILLENLLRHEDGLNVTAKEIEAVANWDAKTESEIEIAFMPTRVVLQDFTGVPCVVDLAAMRDAVTRLGGSPSQINPLIPSELVIDHSVQVDVFGSQTAFRSNVENGVVRRSTCPARCCSRDGSPGLQGVRVIRTRIGSSGDVGVGL